MELLSRQKLDAFLSIIGKFRIFKGKAEPATVLTPLETTTVSTPLPSVNPTAMPLAKNVNAYFGHVKWTGPQAEAPPIAPLSLETSAEPAAAHAMPLFVREVAQERVDTSSLPPNDVEPLRQVNVRPVTGTVNAFFSAVAWSGKLTISPADSPVDQMTSQPQSMQAEKSPAYGLVGGVQDYFASISWTGHTGATQKSTVAVLERPAPQEEQASEDFFGDISWD